MEERTLELTLLYDFFGELLTEKQRAAFDLYYNDDLSLSEIAELTGVSRQGVRDSVVKAKKALLDYEARTGVVARFTRLQKELRGLTQKAARLESLLPPGEAKALSQELRDGIEGLKDGI
ncbi:MAG: YlxM family DNA-binding protein [bacterium]